MCYATRQTHPLLYCASTTAAGGTTALAATSATFASCIGRLAGSAATASAGWHTGHVTVGGSMCTELLTPGGWQPMTVHALLLTVCQMLRQGEAQIQLKPDEHCMWPLKDYSEMEAREAYERVAKFHGWPTQRRHS